MIEANILALSMHFVVLSFTQLDFVSCELTQVLMMNALCLSWIFPKTEGGNLDKIQKSSIFFSQDTFPSI